ncbi:MAG TPA: hypothetical protein DCX54_12200 [Flavobacteriales bacterium]|nr:hypothetical protein [Flavobacteriales bacterium]
MTISKKLILASAVLFALSCSKKKDDPSAPIVTLGCFDRPDYTNQLPNFDFDEWGTPIESGGKYETPCGGIWSSGNPGTALTGQVTTYKTTDAISGDYAVEMTTISSQNLIAGGSIYVGKFKLNLNNTAKSAKLGMPFTYKPVSMTGFYKYTPVNGDSSNIIILLTKYNQTTGQRDTVGFANQPGYDLVSTYTAFELVVDYNYPAGNEKPDTVVVNFTSSKAAEFFKGEIGSTFKIDNCKFTY